MIMRLAKAAILAAALVAIVASVPDLKRYLELRDM
jgi:glutaredoxin-related protein